MPDGVQIISPFMCSKKYVTALWENTIKKKFKILTFILILIFFVEYEI